MHHASAVNKLLQFVKSLTVVFKIVISPSNQPYITVQGISYQQNISEVIGIIICSPWNVIRLYICYNCVTDYKNYTSESVWLQYPDHTMLDTRIWHFTTLLSSTWKQPKFIGSFHSYLLSVQVYLSSLFNSWQAYKTTTPKRSLGQTEIWITT